MLERGNQSDMLQPNEVPYHHASHSASEVPLKLSQGRKSQFDELDHIILGCKIITQECSFRRLSLEKDIVMEIPLTEFQDIVL